MVSCVLHSVFQIEAELSKERARHLVEFEEQALLFKKEAKLELDIEKEKHQEIIQKYKKEQEELQMKVYNCHVHYLMCLELQMLVFPPKNTTIFKTPLAALDCALALATQQNGLAILHHG